jgi:hypothetical protein
MNVEIEDSVITSGLPRAIEFRQESRTTGIREGFFSSNVITSTGVSPLRLDMPVNFYEQALFKTIRDQANKRSRSDSNHSGIQYNIDRVDPPACTSQLSEDKSEDDMLMIVNTLKSSEANLSVTEADKGKVVTPPLHQTVEVSVEESNMDPAAAECVEVKLLSANLKKLEAVQIMMKVAKLEAEAKAKAAEVAILKAKLALKDANEGASNTQQGRAGNGNKDVDITDSIERIIANAESQIILENSIVDSDSDSSPAPSLDDSEFDILPSPPSLVYESNDTSETMPIIINLVDPPFIIRQSSVPSPSPEKSALQYTKLVLELEQRDENNITSKNNDGIDSTLELLYTKIEECRTKLMDPNSSMDDQTDAAQLMTQYAKSAQALKRAFRVD